jgi:hypothetical protein
MVWENLVPIVTIIRQAEWDQAIERANGRWNANYCKQAEAAKTPHNDCASSSDTKNPETLLHIFMIPNERIAKPRYF